jgi:hypothetical protein
VLTAVGAGWRLFITVALGVGLLDYIAAPQPPLIASTTLTWMADLSAVATGLVLGALILGVIYLDWRVGAAAGPAIR